MKASNVSKNGNPTYQQPYDEEFRRNAVELLFRTRKPLKQISRELEISDSSLREWRAKYGKEIKVPRDIKKRERWSRMKTEAENERLRQENAQLKRQADILKKALSIISEPLPGDML